MCPTSRALCAIRCHAQERVEAIDWSEQARTRWPSLLLSIRQFLKGGGSLVARLRWREDCESCIYILPVCHSSTVHQH